MLVDVVTDVFVPVVLVSVAVVDVSVPVVVVDVVLVLVVAMHEPHSIGHCTRVVAAYKGLLQKGSRPTQEVGSGSPLHVLTVVVVDVSVTVVVMVAVVVLEVSTQLLHRIGHLARVRSPKRSWSHNKNA